MAPTQAELARVTGAWRRLARAVLAFACDPVREPAWAGEAREATKWISPLERSEDAYVLFGFARLATALARTRLVDIPARAAAVCAVAELVLALVGAEDPRPPQLPFRADIDG